MENANPYQDKLNRWSSHSKIATLLVGLPKGTRILDVGAGSGTLARLCMNQGFYICGIEPNSNWLGNTRSLYAEFFDGSLEQAPDDFLEDYQVVVCADVLEHLNREEEQLSRLVKAQQEGCIFILSVPNVANLWVRVNLIFGHFDYTDKGILDKTHLHFYTRQSFLSLVKSTGLIINSLEATPIPLDLITPFFSENIMGRIFFYFLTQLTRWWPTLFGYQWVAKAHKVKS